MNSENNCVIELDYDGYRLGYGLFGVLSWFWGLGMSLECFGVVWVREKRKEKPRFLGSRRSAAALFLGAAARGCIRIRESHWAPRPLKGVPRP